MPFIPAPNIIQVEILATKDGQIIENRVMIDAFHAPSAADYAALLPQFTNWLNTSYAPLLPQEVVITGLKFTDKSQQNGPFQQTALTIPGSNLSGSLPNEVTFCVSLRTNSAGRSARGRFYWLGIPIDQRSGQNRVISAFRANTAGAVTGLAVSIASVGMAMVIVSYFSNGVPRPGGPVYFPVATGVTTDDILDSQRRRRPGIGS
jgi:hypothetical protein